MELGDEGKGSLAAADKEERGPFNFGSEILGRATPVVGAPKCKAN